MNLYKKNVNISFLKLLSHLSGANELTYWGRVMHIYITKLTIIGSNNGLLPGWHQAIIWTNAGILFIRNLGINFNVKLSEIHIFSFKKMLLKMLSMKRRPSCLGFNVSAYHMKEANTSLKLLTHFINFFQLKTHFRLMVITWIRNCIKRQISNFHVFLYYQIKSEFGNIWSRGSTYRGQNGLGSMFCILHM